jgi:hypothetical protein
MRDQIITLFETLIAKAESDYERKQQVASDAQLEARHAYSRWETLLELQARIGVIMDEAGEGAALLALAGVQDGAEIPRPPTPPKTPPPGRKTKSHAAASQSADRVNAIIRVIHIAEGAVRLADVMERLPSFLPEKLTKDQVSYLLRSNEVFFAVSRRGFYELTPAGHERAVVLAHTDEAGRPE